MRTLHGWFGLLGASVCGLVGCDAGPPIPATTIVEAPGAGAHLFGDPARATNGVRGGGAGAGSLDVFSIEYGRHLVVSWGGRRAYDGPGPDLAIFENPFELADGSRFMDQVVVEVSLDGFAWVALPHDYLAPDELVYSTDAEHWRGFAGVSPVHLHADELPVDPFDTELAGGDVFDLDALPQGGEAERIREEGFAFVRMSPARDHVNPDTGEPFPRDPVANGPDIDGVYARYLEAP